MNARPKACGGVNTIRVQHTKGPWRVRETATRSAIDSAHDGTIAYVQIRAEQDFNAALIAAAPHLLKLAIRYASECGECAGVGICPGNSPCDDCKDIRELIAKATVPA